MNNKNKPSCRDNEADSLVFISIYLLINLTSALHKMSEFVNSWMFQSFKHPKGITFTPS